MIRRFVVLLVFAITISGDIGLLQDEGEEHTVTVDGFGSNIRFVPETLTINEGDTVRFLWSGELLPHNAIEQNDLFNSGDAMRDVDYTFTFDYNQSGVYDFYCEPHRDLGMLGEITVLDVAQDNISTGDDLETKTDDVVSENNSKINFNILSVVVLVILFLIYYRTRIDNITKI
ncbi:MAG: plastocyanin/azurin family copper-binding protein [Candidatus Poseidoniaceae archaeon]|nr:plastocyanin/azurin family copper-binding protein [Candidatus Poseidoniaceae archaeon]